MEKLLETFEFHFYFRNYLRGETFVQFGPKKTQLSNEIWAPSGRNSGQGQGHGPQGLCDLATSDEVFVRVSCSELAVVKVLLHSFTPSK